MNPSLHKATLEQGSSAEQCNDYLHVSRPSAWLTLWTVIVLLVGVLVWCVFGTRTTNLSAVAVVSEGRAICYLSSKNAADLTVGMPVRIAERTGTVINRTTTPMEITDAFDPYALYLGEFQKGDFVVSAVADIDMPDGVYAAIMVVESVSPISFILN